MIDVEKLDLDNWLNARKDSTKEINQKSRLTGIGRIALTFIIHQQSISKPELQKSKQPLQ